MITTFTLDNSKTSFEDASYIVSINPNQDEKNLLRSYFNLQLRDLDYKSNHFIMPVCNHFNNIVTLQLLSPIQLEKDGIKSIEHATTPLYLIITRKQIAIIGLYSIPSSHVHILDSFHNTTQTITPLTIYAKLISAMTRNYIHHSELLFSQLDKSEQILRKSQSNEEFINLSEIEESFLILKAALISNISIIEKSLTFRSFTVRDKHDIENNLEKLKHIVNLYDSQIPLCQTIRDSYAIFVSNKLNITMRTLAILTIFFAIPNIFFGFYGMNVNLPIAKIQLAYAIILILVGIVSTCLYYLLKKLKAF